MASEVTPETSSEASPLMLSGSLWTSVVNWQTVVKDLCLFSKTCLPLQQFPQSWEEFAKDQNQVFAKTAASLVLSPFQETVSLEWSTIAQQCWHPLNWLN